MAVITGPEMRAGVSSWFISRALEWDVWTEREGMGGMLGCIGGRLNGSCIQGPGLGRLLHIGT